MRLLNEPLANHTTFKIGGPADILVIPEDEAELISVIQECKKANIPYRIIGNGSNILADDEGFRGCIIKNTAACSQLYIQDNAVHVGSSVRLQRFIKFCVDNNLGGCEYLYSVPATVGGAIFMNAGRGRTHNEQISDYLDTVTFYDGQEVRDLKNTDCEFSYRSSKFQMIKEAVILSATFKLPFQSSEVGNSKIKERMYIVKRHQDQSHPSAGSIFKCGNRLIYYYLRGKQIGGAKFSSKALNWISNTKSAKSGDVVKLIKHAKAIHSLFFQKCETELFIMKSRPTND